jgi:hypothetical protein
MRPYFSYTFYTFEDVFSPSLPGNQPNFGHAKNFEVEMNQQFSEYLRTQIMPIYVMDDSVDGNKEGQSDAIGIARIRLKDLMSVPIYHQNIEVRDENDQVNGQIEVMIEMRDIDKNGGFYLGKGDLRVGKDIEN